MITLAMATEVAASRAALWRCLVDPDEVARWSPGARGRARVQAPWPRAGGALRLAVCLREVPVELRQRVLESRAGRRLRCEVRLGLYRFEATFTLAEEAARRTRLTLRVVTPAEVPLVGASLDRFASRRLAADLAATWLAALRDRAEAAARPAPAAEAPLAEPA